MIVIDFHTHAFPQHTASKAIDYLSKKAGIKAYTDGTLEGLKRSMKKAEINYSVICNIATRPKHVDAIFSWCNSIKNNENNIISLPSILPNMRDRILWVEKIAKAGFKGIKLHPEYQNFFVDDRNIYELYEAIEEKNMFILFHAGEDSGFRPPFHSCPMRFSKLIRDLPNVKIIIAHMGSYRMYKESEKYILGKNVFIDTSYCLSEIPLEMLKKFFSKHPVERIIFGTDSPWRDQKTCLEYFLSLPFVRDEDKEKILYLNAKNLIKL